MTSLAFIGLGVLIGALVVFWKRRAPTRHHSDGPVCGVKADIFFGEFDQLFRTYGRDSAFDWRMLKAVAWIESNYDPCAVGLYSEVGLCQVSRPWESQLGIDIDTIDGNVRAAAWIIDYELKEWHQEIMAIAAYNGGDHSLREAGAPDDPNWRTNLLPSIQRHLDRYEQAVTTIRSRLER